MIVTPCAALEGAGTFARGFMGCFCCVLLGGPILLAVGIVLLLGENNRSDLVAQYNAAVANFDTSGMSDWATAGGAMGRTGSTQSFTMQISSISIGGDDTDVNTTGYSYFGENTFTGGGNTSSLTFAANTGTPFTRTGVLMFLTDSSGQQCWTSSTSCTSATMQNLCQSDKGFSATYSGGSCPDGSTCGTCTVRRYLTTYCAVLSRTPGVPAWTEASYYKSCKYPFASASQTYGGTAAQTTVNLELYSDSDPLITLEAVTQGTHSFGIAKASQRKLGTIFVAVGSSVVVLMCAALIVTIKLCVSSKNRTGDSSSTAVDSMAQSSSQRTQQQQQGPVLPAFAPQGYGQQQQQHQQQQQQPLWQLQQWQQQQEIQYQYQNRLQQQELQQWQQENYGQQYQGHSPARPGQGAGGFGQPPPQQQPSPSGYGQQPSIYGPPSSGVYGQPSQLGYNQPAASGYVQPQPGAPTSTQMAPSKPGYGKQPGLY